MKVRVKFTKTGALRYIGHLDIMRYFQKAVRRSGIAASYSRGFSPHMIMSFASPLGVGVTSSGEYFDMELDYRDPYGDAEDTDVSAFAPCPSEEALIAALNAQMADGVEILSVRRIAPGRRGNAMSLVAAASYTVSFDLPEDAEIRETLAQFLAQPEILAQKKTKSGMKTEDIKPLIYKVNAPGDGSPAHSAVLSLFCASGSEANLKPDAFFDALCRFTGWEIAPWDVRYHRNDLYARTEAGSFVPLSDLGQKI